MGNQAQKQGPSGQHQEREDAKSKKPQETVAPTNPDVVSGKEEPPVDDGRGAQDSSPTVAPTDKEADVERRPRHVTEDAFDADNRGQHA